MVEGTPHRSEGTTGHTQVDWFGCLWLWSIALVMLLLSSGLLPSGPEAAERARPRRIGGLTDSWGSTPHMAGLRDGLLALGYREREDFVIGVRFTQGNHALLPAAAHELVRDGFVPSLRMVVTRMLGESRHFPHAHNTVQALSHLNGVQERGRETRVPQRTGQLAAPRCDVMLWQRGP